MRNRVGAGGFVRQTPPTPPDVRARIRRFEWLRLASCHSVSAGTSLVLLHPLLTSRSAFASPFQAQGEISPGKVRGLPRATAGFTSPPLGRESFAGDCPLALVSAASYPVSVRRLAVSLPASFSAPSREFALRFAFGRYDQLPKRTFTSKSRPCWAHNQEARKKVWGHEP